MINEEDDSEKEEQLEALASRIGARLNGFNYRKKHPIERGVVQSEFNMTDDVGAVKVIVKKSTAPGSNHFWLIVKNIRSKGEDIQLCNYQVDEWQDLAVDQYAENDLVDLLKNCIKLDWTLQWNKPGASKISDFAHEADNNKLAKFSWFTLSRQLGVRVLTNVNFDPAMVERYREKNKNRLLKSKWAEDNKKLAQIQIDKVRAALETRQLE